MGNCLKCFQASTTTTTINTGTENITRGLQEIGRIDSSSYYPSSNAHDAVYQARKKKLSNQQLTNIGRVTTTTTATTTILTANTVVTSTTSNIEGRYGGVGIGLGLGTILNHNRRNFIYGEKSHETEDLLASKSPLKIENNCDTKRSSFKISLGKLNANSATMGDIITTETHEISDNALNLLFEAYKDPDVDMILTDGIERLCQDLNYQPDEFAILVLAWCLDASQMCQFTKAEFIEGLHKICADSIKTIRIRLEQTIEMLRVDTEMFKQLYRFTFRFGLEPDQRILSLEMAISLWKLVFTVHTPDILKNWLHFLEKNPSIRGIPKDTWNMFLNFSEQCDINNYDDTEAWPSLFDDFVDYEKLRIINDNDGISTDVELDNSKILSVNKLDDDESGGGGDDTNEDANNIDISLSIPSTSTAFSETGLQTPLDRKEIVDSKSSVAL